MHTILTQTPSKLPGTDWTVTQMLPISLSGPLTSIKLGNARVTNGSGTQSHLGWRAQWIENHWNVMRDGREMPNNQVGVGNEVPLFLNDSVANAKIIKFISDWLDEEFDVKSSPPKPPQKPQVLAEVVAGLITHKEAPPPTTQLVPQGPPAINSAKSLSDRVAEEVCATYEAMTVAEMRNSKNRGLFTEARQIIVYLLRELGEKNRVILEAIGAAPTATSLIYIHHTRIAELMKTDEALKVKVEVLQASCKPLVGKVEAGAAEQQLVLDMHSHNGNGLVGKITSLVSEVVCTPALLGTGTPTLSLGPARVAMACLLFRLYKAKRESSKTAVSVDGQIVEAFRQLCESDTEVSRIVSEVEKRLKPTA